MEYMSNIQQNFQQYIPYFLAGLSILVIILAAIVISLHSKVNSLKRRYQRMMQGMEGVNIERMMIGHIDEVKDAMVTVERLKSETKRLENLLQYCVQRIGLVRFNAFEDTGSDLSFALALLDDKNNGVVLSSLYGRSESRIYAKPVINLQSKYVLSAEEQKALKLAKESSASIAAAAETSAPPPATRGNTKKQNDDKGMLTPEEKDLLGSRK